MAIGANDIVINITPNPIKGTVGKDIVVDITFTNNSTMDTAYNLYSKLIIPDGLEFKAASEQIDSSNLTSNYSEEQTWFNIQNIGPGQTYILKVVLQGLINYRNPNKGKVIFNRPIDGVTVNAIMDTMLRGDKESGNTKVSKTFQVNFIPLPYSLEITAPSKMPKGAGQLQPIIQPQWKYNYIIKIDNGSVKQTNTSLTFRLNNGIRYLSISSVTGPDIAQFDNVTIVNPSSEADYTLLIWNNLSLSEESIYEITIEVAIWNKYALNGIENSGSIIPHGTLISSIGTLTGTEGQVQNFAYVKAMYFTIDKKVANNTTNVNTKNQYTLTYDVNQYTGITEGEDTETFQIIDTIGDGQTYNSDANVIASDVISNNNETIILWDIPSIFPTDGGNAGISKTITYSTTTKGDYANGVKVKSFDILSNRVIMNALTTDTNKYINDTSEDNISVIIPTISKELLKYYYADNTEKTSLIGAPGDFAQFKITYDATTINAEQDNIIIRDFFPSSFSNVISDISYGGSFSMPTGVVPEVIEPNGVQWQLGNIPAKQDWTVTFKVLVTDVINTDEKNYNVAVDMGQNNINNYFNKRSYINVNIGRPNIRIDKTVKGLQVDNIKPGESYTYTITVNNNQDSIINVTDAFEMTLIDSIPNGLSYKVGSATVQGTGDYGLPAVFGQTLTLDINKLEPNENLILIYDVIVDNDVPLGATLKNTATLSVPYSQPDKSYQYPGEPLIATTTLKTETIIYFTKIVSPPSTKIGDVVTYILDIRVPKGTIVSNVQIKDTFPNTNQEFIPGSVTKDGVLIELQPIPIGGVLTFPEVFNIDASDATTVLVYSFSTRVIDAAVNDNFIDTQVNNAVLTWMDANTGVIGAPIKTSTNLDVNIPSLQILKSQSNITKNIDYTSETVSFQGGDILSYRINVINEGTAISYNNVITDMISNYFNVDKNSIVTSNGDVVFQGNILKWNIEQIRPNEIVTLTFNLNVSNQLPNTLAIENIASGIYESNNNEFSKNYGPVKSNTVIFNLLNMRFTKTASLNEIEIGDTIKYTITLNVIEGTTLYDVSIYDLLPNSQEYVVGSATKQIGVEPPIQVTPTITPESGGGSNRITFPQPIVGTNNNIEALNKEVQVKYEFDAVIQQGLGISPYWQDQTNTAYVKWDSIGDGSGSQEKEATTTITVNVPKVTIYKEQKNFTQYGTSGYFTKGNIIVDRNDIIYYQIKVESDGSSPGYNINIEDILDNKVEFIGTIQAPTIGTVTLPTLNNPLQWNIPTLTENTTATYIFSVKVNDSLVIGTEINNSISGTYSSTNNGGKNYNLVDSSVKAIVGGIKVTKTCNVSEVDLGDEVEYNIQIIIPKNNIIHDLIVTDNLDIGQQYINNSWTSSLGVAATPTVINNGNTLIYEETTNPITSPVDSDLTINYTLKAKVSSSSNLPPYEQEQINTCNVTWSNTAGGKKIKPIVANVSVMVKRPNLEPLKLLRNVTKGQIDFTYVPEQTVTAGDIMEYKLSLTNKGKATAYNVVVNDVIVVSTSFINEGNPNVYITGHGIGWNPNKPILPGQIEEVIIKVRVASSYTPGQYVQNVFSGNYDSGTVYPIAMPTLISNYVYYTSSRIDVKQYLIRNETQEENTVALAGEIIGYKIVITVPKGVIAYNFTTEENLNPNQEYIPNSLKSIGGQTPIPKDTPILIFPNEGTIDATLETKVIIYTFNVKVNKTNSDPTQGQLSIVNIRWSITPGGTSSLNSYNNVLTVSSPIDLKINTTIDYKNIKLNDSVLYTLTISNASSTEVYNANITENLPTGFVLQEISSVQYNSLVIIKDAIEGATNFNIVIPTLLANSTCTIEFYATVVGPIVPGGDLINSANISYSLTPNTLTQIYGPVKFSDAITFDDTIEFTKSSSVMDAQLGDIIMYHLNAEIPQGIMIYGAEIEDVLPDGQMYTGEATLNGNPIYIHENGQELMSNKIPVVYAKDDKINLHYIINARVVTVMDIPPFLEVKQNNAWFRWYTDPSYVTSKEVTANTNVIVRATTLDLVKLQRNKTQNTMFNYIEMNVDVGDLIEYKLVIQNLGDTAIYNIITEDILEDFTTFNSVIDSTIGSVTFDNSTNQLIWTIDILKAKSIAILIFECKVLPGAIVGASKTNVATTRFNTSIDDPTVKGPIQSEVLTHNYPILSMELISDKYYYIVGDIVIYNIIIKVPKGMDFYNLSVEDILPVEQTFISSTLNGTEIIPQVEGQLIKFPVIDSITLKNGESLKRFVDYEMIYNYEIKAKIDGVKDPNASADIQIDSASMTWSLDPANIQVQGPISKTVEISVVDNLISVQKWQKFDNRGKFTTKELDVNNRDIIQYKIVATNIGTVKAYNMSIVDILDNGVEYINTISITNGSVEIKRIDNNNVLIWDNISELDPNQTVELIFSVRVISLDIGNISNYATPRYSITPTSERFEGLTSNVVILNTLGKGYNFIPEKNNYISDNEALSYGVKGCYGKIGYILTNTFKSIRSYTLHIDAIPFQYELFIDNKFIEEIPSNVSYDGSPLPLQYVSYNSKNIIELRYYIPEEYNLVNNQVDFNVTINLLLDDAPTTIKSRIVLGEVKLSASYNISGYSDDPKLFLQQYDIQVNISKGIKIYDVELEAFYPPSYIFEAAYINGVPIEVINRNIQIISSYSLNNKDVAINLNGRIIYPIIEEVNATENEVLIKYSFELLQYKKIPLKVGALAGNKVILSLRTSPNIEDKCSFINNLYQLQQEESICVYVNKLFGKCVQYYSYKNIAIPVINGYVFNKVVFHNPEIIKESLIIKSSTCNKEFSEVKYEFIIPYTIIYQGCGCLSSGECSTLTVTEVNGVLEKRNLSIVIYMPNNNEKIYDIISESIIKNIVINENHTEFCVCIGVITSSIAKKMITINELGKCELLYCCPNCNPVNNTK
ncbi:hypothetical protein C3495_11930 [Clostridiaceae bacterium 14S0207]|nr:hypothetical protein C3495_11930 [Clostridiaceae bacterium 14S0207]